MASTENGTEVVPHTFGRLQHEPIIDRIAPRTLELIQRQVAPGCTTAEVGHFLELCANYDLDPFAKEAWCAKNKGGDKLLIMVGRDGLRKIAHRQGLHIDGDVVREKDELTVTRTPDGNRTIAHSYGNPAERGKVIGAWAEVREGRPSGRPMGYFYAPLDEYRPSNASAYSPWSKQIGVMILAAAERQAIRQATPLGGLIAEGEDEVVFDYEATAEEAPVVAKALIDEAEAKRIRAMLEEVAWPDGELRMQLVAAGAADISDIGLAIANLTRPQAEALTHEINAVLDARDVAEMGGEGS